MTTPKPLKTIRVAVFVHPGRSRNQYSAYTRWYNKDWPGCNIVEVEAENGDCAKRLAIAEVKRMEMAGEPVNINRIELFREE